MDLPKRSEPKRIGNIAASLAESFLSNFVSVIPVPESKDLGIDFYCEVIDEEGFPNGQQFNVQCKGIENFKKGETDLSISVKVSTANYWLIQPAATFLIAVDIAKRDFYWAYPRLKLTEDFYWQSNKTVSIKIPIASRFSLDSTSLPVGMINDIDIHIPAGINTLLDQFEKKRNPLELDKSKFPINVVNDMIEIADTFNASRKMQDRISIITNNLGEETLSVVNKIREQSSDLLGKLDYTEGAAKLWKNGKSIYSFEFGAGTVEKLWDRIDKAVINFEQSNTRQNHSELLSALSQLIQLNIDIYWTIETL